MHRRSFADNEYAKTSEAAWWGLHGWDDAVLYWSTKLRSPSAVGTHDAIGDKHKIEISRDERGGEMCTHLSYNGYGFFHD